MSYKKFTKDVGIIGLTNLAAILKGIIILPFITKLLGAENYGIWTQLGVTLGLVTPIILLGLPSSLVRFLAAEKNKKEIQEGVYSVLTVIAVFASIIGLLLVIFSSPIASFFQCQPLFIKIFAFIILLECLISVILNIFRAFQEIRKYSFFTIIQSIGEAGLIVLAVLLDYGLLGAVISLLIIRIAVFLIVFSLILKKVGIKIPSFSKIKEYLIFGLPKVVGSISYWAITSSDRYLIGFFLGVLFVGYYAPAYAIGNVINLFLLSITFSLLPVISKSFDENKINEVKNYLKYCLKYFLMIAVPAAFGLSILSKSLLTIFSTREIASNAYYITPFVALSILLYGVSSFHIQVLNLVKKTKIIGAVWLVAALLNLVLNFVFIPIFGILAAAITTLLAYGLGLGLFWYFSSKEFRFEVDWKFIIKSVLASALMGFVIYWINPVGLLKTAIVIIFGAVLYGLLIWLLRGFDKKEIEFLKGLLRS